MTAAEALRLGLEAGPSDETREAACGHPWAALYYARSVDRGPSDATRSAACRDPWAATYYARDVDLGQRSTDRA